MKDIVLGIGNTQNSDDGVGVYIAERISKDLKKPREAEDSELPREIIAINRIDPMIPANLNCASNVPAYGTDIRLAKFNHEKIDNTIVNMLIPR